MKCTIKQPELPIEDGVIDIERINPDPGEESDEE